VQRKFGELEDSLIPGIKLEVLWFDDDLIELGVSGSNGRFAGTTELYVGHDPLGKLADAFRGFPASRQDRREMELGTFDPKFKFSGGGARFRLRCMDAAGHVILEVQLRTDPGYDKAGQSQAAEFFIPLEPAAIDDFVAAVGAMKVAVGATARLKQAT
jgi:hypothetical protein